MSPTNTPQNDAPAESPAAPFTPEEQAQLKAAMDELGIGFRELMDWLGRASAVRKERARIAQVQGEAVERGRQSNAAFRDKFLKELETMHKDDRGRYMLPFSHEQLSARLHATGVSKQDRHRSLMGVSTKLPDCKEYLCVTADGIEFGIRIETESQTCYYF